MYLGTKSLPLCRICLITFPFTASASKSENAAGFQTSSAVIEWHYILFEKIGGVRSSCTKSPANVLVLFQIVLNFFWLFYRMYFKFSSSIT